MLSEINHCAFLVVVVDLYCHEIKTQVQKMRVGLVEPEKPRATRSLSKSTLSNSALEWKEKEMKPKKTTIKNPEPQMAFADMITPKDKLRHSGLHQCEEKALKIFALSDGYPRQCLVERTGTMYTINGPYGAQRLLKALHFASKGIRGHVTQPAENPQRMF